MSRGLPGISTEATEIVPGWRATRVAICVPVKNERTLLPDLLDALAGQAVPPGVQVTACFYFDGCTDDSARVVLERALPWTVRIAEGPAGRAANAGRARRHAMQLGIDLADATTALLSTDADSVPAPDWLATNCLALADADVVAGRIVRQAAAAVPAQCLIEDYYDRLYALRRRIDPVAWEAPSTHHYTSGASLAFRADAYAATGGFEACAAGEDARIVDVARRLGLRVRHDAAVRVETSSRRVGRAVDGLADHLRAIDVAGSAIARTLHPELAAWKYHAHALARAGFPTATDPASAARLATALGIGADAVRDYARHAANAEAFATCIVPDPPGDQEFVAIDVARQALADIERQRMEVAA